MVVATDAQLKACLDTPPYSWLRDPALVIIDEAHTSITPLYTRLLTSMGLTFRETSRPLIGLTATPFRGFNEAETRRLVDRYGGNRLDTGIFETGDPYAELQDLGVLARVEHRQLQGMTLTLSEEDLQQVTTFEGAGLPSTVEAKLALDNARNEMLIREIEALPNDSPVLLFAISVNHAKTLAAKLNGRGIRSAAIESGTPDANRRSLIEQFRRKQIRVLTNFGVLAQGFDAPATEVVIVARPTYSPNIYQQMIGRGLRGPKNGGKETCLILDVADNLINYERQAGFHAVRVSLEQAMSDAYRDSPAHRRAANCRHAARRGASSGHGRGGCRQDSHPDPSPGSAGGRGEPGRRRNSGAHVLSRGCA